MPDRLESDLVPIGAVVAELRRAYPDVSHSSLRFLEREGLVRPHRTPGGHRLYTPADVERIRTIKRWQAQRLSLGEIRQRLDGQRTLDEPKYLSARLLEAALRDGTEANRLVLQADDLGMPLVATLQDVLCPALVEVGKRWAAGALRVGQEHEVTETLRAQIAELSWRHANPRPEGPPLLAASVAGERHDLGLRMVVALLRASGRDVRFLGADVEARILAEEAATRQPAAVLLSATLAERWPAIEGTVVALRDAAPEAIVFLGGRVAQTHGEALARMGVTPVDEDALAAAVREILSLTARARS